MNSNQSNKVYAEMYEEKEKLENLSNIERGENYDRK